MSKYDYVVLKHILDKGYTNQRDISSATGYSLGKVNESIRKLIRKNFLSATFAITEKTQEEIKLKKPRNAIILAAGYGSRMVPINNKLPKGLLKVQDETLIERLICQLHEVGIFDIDIVVGFLMEKYEYLIDKYGVNLVYNKEFKEKNNLHSLNVVAHKISNTYIVPCDIWSKNNPFSTNEFFSWYLVTKAKKKDSTVRINRNKKAVYAKEEEMGNKMIGISYLLEEEASRVRHKLGQFANMKRHRRSLWEEVLYDRNNKMFVFAKAFKDDEIFDINTYEELRELDENSMNLDSKAISLIAKNLDVDVSDITEITILKKGMTNRSFKFICKGKKYIMRIPGEGTEKLVNRKNEYNVYAAIKDKNISDNVIYISEDSGYKITEFIKDTRSCDPTNESEVGMCMDVLRSLHDQKLQVPHTFDIFEKIELYESLWKDNPSIFYDYKETKTNVYALKEVVDSIPKAWTLTHMDANQDNFLLTEDKIHLIDWEYSSMQDPHVDIAMFAIYAMYDKEQVDKLIDIYFEGSCSLETRKKIYCYISMCGLLWSNWCEYKRLKGIDFGEYALRQYRYAKDFYRIVMEMERQEEVESYRTAEAL